MTQTKAELLQTRHQGDIRLGDADSTHYVGFKAPATVGTSLVWTLPAADGTANYLLKTDGSGNLGWVADSTTDSTKMPLSGGNFSGHVTFLDNIKAKFGSGGDLEIFHDTNDSYITNTGVGNLIIRGDDVHIQGSNGENMVNCNEDGSVDISFNNVKKFETTTNGISVTGQGLFSGNIETSEHVNLTADNKKIKIGAGEDLQLWHDSSNSYITNTTGVINIQAKQTENSIVLNPDGAVQLYHNNVKTLETTTTGILVSNPASSGDAVVNVKGGEGGSAILQLQSDEGDDNADFYRLLVPDTSQFNIQTYTSGSWANILTLDNSSNATFASAIYGPVKTVSALELDLSTGNYFIKTISGNSTFTFANPAASGTVTAFTLELTHSSGTVTWPSSVKWNADTAPTLTTGKTHLFMFVTDDGGTRYRGSALVDYVN
jgi:hypothetical protein